MGGPEHTYRSNDFMKSPLVTLFILNRTAKTCVPSVYGPASSRSRPCVSWNCVLLHWPLFPPSGWLMLMISESTPIPSAGTLPTSQTCVPTGFLFAPYSTTSSALSHVGSDGYVSPFRATRKSTMPGKRSTKRVKVKAVSTRSDCVRLGADWK